MKFGKHLQHHTHPEWAIHYMNYKTLKKMIKAAEKGGAASQDQTKAFFYSLDRDLERVNSFYLEKENELKARLKLLLDKKQIIIKKTNKSPESLLSLQEAFIQFQQELIKLQNFVEMNGTGFRKILKKFDRRTKATTKEIYLSSHVQVQPCFNKEILTELADHAANELSDLEQVLRQSNEVKTKFESWSQQTNLENDIYKAVTTDDEKLASEALAKLRRLFQEGQGQGQGQSESDIIYTAFRRSCSNGSVKCAKLFISSGIDARVVDEVSGRSSLHDVAMTGRLDILTLLVESGKADIHCEDIHGRRPLHYASMGGFEFCARYLLDKGATNNAIDQEGMTPMICAIIKGNTMVVKAFLDANQTENTEHTGRSPLCLAAEYGHADIVELLISHGYDVNQRNANGLSPLHLTCRRGHAKCCEILTKYGADVSAIDKYNIWTPLFYAASEGHTECVKILIKTPGCRIDIYDESNWTPWQHALYGGHIQTAELLKLAPTSMTSPQRNAMASTNLNDVDADMDLIPSLELPPPMIPCKIYGHTYLEEKIQVQIKLGFPNSGGRPPLHLFDSRQSVSLKLNISSQPNGSIPHTVILPLEDEQETFTFSTKSLSNFTLYFDILPTFGTKIIGRAVALPFTFNSTEGKTILSVFDRFEFVGELAFEFVTIKPFSHPSMAISGKIQTYWKSSTTFSPGKTDPFGGHMKDKATTYMVTSSSLAKEYIMLSVQSTKDGIPVIYDEDRIPGIPFDLRLNDITYQQFQQLPLNGGLARIQHEKGSNFNLLNEKKEALEKSSVSILHELHISLQEVLKSKTNIGICLDIKYDMFDENNNSKTNPNEIVDSILKTVYDCAGPRSMIFCSSNPTICLMFNLKQPNYPVFFKTLAGTQKFKDDRCNSIHQAIRFAKAANLLGIVCIASPLVQVPALVKTIKSAGLVLATFGEENASPSNVALQEKNEVDAIIYRGSIRVKTTVEF